MPMQPNTLFIGLMSGTSLDGADGALAEIPPAFCGGPIRTLGAAYVPFSPRLRADLMGLQAAGHNEVEREALAANQLADHYAECVEKILSQSGVAREKIAAVGVHGQTIRHQPASGYTRQTNNPALLAERLQIDVIADFRSRDIAAGGQGAPLVPAFHRAVFGSLEHSRVVANIGGISNISVLRNGVNGRITGFDTGPGNVLMDSWIAQHKGEPYDANGAWAASGSVISTLLNALLREPFLSLAPPKSTGRDLFHLGWLSAHLSALPAAKPADVQATLTAFTAATLADAIADQAAEAKEIYLCGGGAYNACLIDNLQAALTARRHSATVATTEALGVPPNHVEALAFAWLAHRFCNRQPGNLPAVTGAAGPRILGALYPA